MRVIWVSILLAFVMGQPNTTREYLEKVEWDGDFRLEEAIYNLTDWDDICFSFDMQIYYNESMPLAVSEKCVYKVENKEEICAKIAQVGKGLDKIYFVIDRRVEDESSEKRRIKEMLVTEKECAYEDERYYVVEVYREEIEGMLL